MVNVIFYLIISVFFFFSSPVSAGSSVNFGDLNPSIVKSFDELKSDTEKKREIFLFGFFSLLLIWLALLSRLGRDFEEQGELLKLIGKLMAEERCEDLRDLVLPLLTVDKEDTFLLKALADCYLKEKHFIEAAAVYGRLAEVLKEKGFEVLADDFKRRSEELLSREFRRG